MLPLEPRHLVELSGASKMVSKPMVRLAQTMHQYCTNTNIVSKREEVRFHKTHITYEFNQVRPKIFLSLWYV
jgi:gamma-glutamylcysteine synthetase